MADEMISLERLSDYNNNILRDANILKRKTSYVLNNVVNKGQVYLKCTQAGTTDIITLPLSNVQIGDILTDGTVKWEVTSTTGPASGESSGAGLEDWESNHNYAVDDIYVYEGEIYKTLVKFTSGTTEDSRTKVNDIVPSVWAANTAYTAGDIIEHTDVTTLKRVYYNVTSNFTSGATFEVTSEMQELQIVEEYVPNPLTDAQVQNLINNFVPSGSGTEPIFYNDSPIGTIISYMGITAPKDYLACDGTVYNIVDYRELAEYIKRQFGSYNYFGGDGTNTFAVPDLRGEFLRGTGTNSHTNQGNGANVGVHQDATEHVNIRNNKFKDVVIPFDSSGNFLSRNTDSYISYKNTIYTTFSNTSVSTENLFYTSRPTNTSVLYCIKYNTSVLSTPENNYSTEEQRIGTWIDGKPLYQITIQDTMPVVTKDGTRATKRIDVSSLKIAFGVHFTGVLVRSGYTVELNSASLNTAIRFGSFDKNANDYDTLFLATNIISDSNIPVIITLQYTKTTD